MSELTNLQEAILQEVRRDRVPVTLFLMNGFQLRGTITGFDSFVVVLLSDGKQQMIYKHAISTLLFVTVLLLLVITNIREARQEQLAMRRRKMPTLTAAEAAQYARPPRFRNVPK